MFHKTILKNGLRIITAYQKAGQAVTVLVLVATGSKYEKKENSGISHFLEHILFKGTKKRPSSLAVSERLDRVGGIYNAFTSEEYTGYFAKVAPEHFDLALDWVSDIYLNSLLPKKEIEKEKGVIIEEINMRYDNPMSYVQILWNKLLYGDQPAGWDIAGTKETVAGVNRQKLLTYLQNQYTASNTVICLAGKINSLIAKRKAEGFFSKISDTQPFEKLKVVEKQNQAQSLLYSRKTGQINFCLGVRGYNLFHPQRYIFEILGVILGGMMSSRLFVEIREKLGIAYYIRTSVVSDSDTGFLVTQAGVENKNTAKAILTILKEYKKISQKKISPSELKKAKEYIKGKTALLLEASDDLACFYGFQELLKKEILTPKQFYAEIDKVGLADILRVSQDIFQSSKLNLTALGPFKNRDKEKFQRLLKL